MSLSGVVLSRLRIVEDVDMETPLCVLEEILDSHRMGFKKGVIHVEYRKSLISHIQKIPVTKLSNPLSSKDLRTLVTYINADKRFRWTRETLFEAYKFLDRFSRISDANTILDTIPGNVVAASQNPEELYNLNACVLYKICKIHGIVTHPYTTLDSMGLAVKLLKGGPDLIYSVLSNFANNSNSRDIINVLVTDRIRGFSAEELEEVTYESLNAYRTDSPYVNGGDSPNRLAKRILPISKSEAVGLGALIYQKDFSVSKCPISEFKKYTENPSRYIPIDETLREMFILNPNLIDLRMVFNPIFPQDYYNAEELINMAIYEGCDPTEVTAINSYEMLQMSYLLENFYEGLYPEIVNEETPIAFDDVNELDPGLVVCYGVRRERLTAFNIEELVEHFTLIKTFAHPVDSQNTLPDNAIRKLKKIAMDNEGGTGQSISMKNRLMRAIEEVEFLSETSNSRALELYECYMRSDKRVKESIELAMKGLLSISMYMRGWKGGYHPFPIREAPVDDQLSVDIAVTTSISEFIEICDGLGEIGRNVMTLPLLKYQGRFNPIGSEDHGFTIEDRLNIVRMGDDTGNIQSCIRLTSNILAATAYRYITLLGMESPFPIDELRYIS